MVDLLYSTGIRVGELFKLNVDDVNFEMRDCLVYGKGEKEQRVYFDARIKLHLQRYIGERDDNKALLVSLNKPHNRLQINCFVILLREPGQRLGVEKFIHIS